MLWEDHTAADKHLACQIPKALIKIYEDHASFLILKNLRNGKAKLSSVLR